ncbi:hypothetical protein DACRYDRAFT_109761 [Dacryopinax primogenitus]|uniref:Uncharacterized protein n=1 Tax=Dacryopinax primogenitus (strain DJM 731) TaxID=1858805 RepID=M5G1F4_DACPD|nr:uncharacterized protein DACRYDRAFT_109761 [Dacryopinax primogenitus]EJT99656.1 hypothetical protein DACRYDRAFT_109761 [Dacryopinax primogenitus]
MSLVSKKRALSNLVHSRLSTGLVAAHLSATGRRPECEATLDELTRWKLSAPFSTSVCFNFRTSPTPSSPHSPPVTTHAMLFHVQGGICHLTPLFLTLLSGPGHCLPTYPSAACFANLARPNNSLAHDRW